MQKNFSVAYPGKHPRIPPEHDGIQVNHCKSPVCRNYGVPPEQLSVRGKNRYTLDRSKGIASCICTFCGVGFPLKSNVGIVEEVERMTSYLSPLGVVCCRNEACANNRDQVPVGIVSTGVVSEVRDPIVDRPQAVDLIC